MSSAADGPRRLLAVALLGLSLSAPAQSDPADLVDAGRRIYQQGILPSGAPLRGVRESGLAVSAADAACIRCHRRSGMGSWEGQEAIPPIIGEALFGHFRKPAEQRPRHAIGMTFTDLPFRTRPPYDAASLAAAIRRGVSTSGHVFSYLMPRYDLDDTAMAALLAYLKTLSAQPSPGVHGSAVDIATVIAPDTPPARREAMLDVLRACLAEREPGTRGTAWQRGEDSWRLHVWQLEGPPAGWQEQLDRRLAAQPVFALVSGLGADDWAPVQRFCEGHGIPCILPNADVPGDGKAGTYSFYFSRGTLLEAAVLARFLQDNRARLGIARIVQLSRADGAGAAAAAALRQALAPALPVETRDFPPALGAFDALAPGTALVLWLRGDDVASLMQARPKPPVGPVFASGLLGGLESIPLSPAWRADAYLLYPVDAPDRWERRARYNLRPWLARQGIPRGDERLQGNTLAACATFAEAMYRTQGVFVRDYLLDMVEAAASEMGNAGASAAFPTFILGTDQRFVSKGAYVARFSGPGGDALVPASGWIVP